MRPWCKGHHIAYLCSEAVSGGCVTVAVMMNTGNPMANMHTLTREM